MNSMIFANRYTGEEVQCIADFFPDVSFRLDDNTNDFFSFQILPQQVYLTQLFLIFTVQPKSNPIYWLVTIMFLT